MTTADIEILRRVIREELQAILNPVSSSKPGGVSSYRQRFNDMVARGEAADRRRAEREAAKRAG